MTPKRNNIRHNDAWARIKRKCRLNQEDIRMAKALGLKPRSLLKNIPNKTESWKAPVKIWIRELYDKRFGHRPDEGTQKGLYLGNRKSETQREYLEPTPSQAEESGKEDSNQAEHPWFRVKTVEELLEKAEREEWPDIELQDALQDFSLWEENLYPSRREIDEKNRFLYKRWKDFQRAARFVAEKLSLLASVEKVLLIGSLAMPLKREIPRFRKFREHGIALWHEVNDVDLAVWLNTLDNLKVVRRTITGCLPELARQMEIQVANHQLDIFLMESGTNRYLGRLCRFNQCPKGKPECLAPSCGDTPFLQQHAGFTFHADTLAAQKGQILYERVIKTKDDELPF